jgi:hypothetical protein
MDFGVPARNATASRFCKDAWTITNLDTMMMVKSARRRQLAKLTTTTTTIIIKHYSPCKKTLPDSYRKFRNVIKTFGRTPMDE